MIPRDKFFGRANHTAASDHITIYGRHGRVQTVAMSVAGKTVTLESTPSTQVIRRGGPWFFFIINLGPELFSIDDYLGRRLVTNLAVNNCCQLFMHVIEPVGATAPGIPLSLSSIRFWYTRNTPLLT